MDISVTKTDNITEVLEKIIEFTDRRDIVLTRNIKNHDHDDYLPMDLDIKGFARLMTVAVSEHIRNERLVLCDSDNIRFGREGSFETAAIVDNEAKKLLITDKQEYINFQIGKLSENMLNKKVATELLEHKQADSVKMFD
ncbi:MAG: hypothetical protein JW912_04945 [Sedimentisphaerales bacterium]|nr:hypothetical protein [Sedimentisphaerales bacterium]